MSNFAAITRHPETGAWQEATWLDHGLSRYTVRFPDGREFREDEIARAAAEADDDVPLPAAKPGDDLSYYLGPDATCATAEQCAEMERTMADVLAEQLADRTRRLTPHQEDRDG